MVKRTLNKLIRGEKGQALVIVLILILLGGLIIGPVLNYMSTGLKVGKEVYENKMYELYAADAGIEDALWYLQSDERLGERFDPLHYGPDWTPNDLSWPIGPYELTDPINEKDVDVTIDHAWVLGDLGFGLPDSEPDEGSSENGNNHWTVIGALNIDVPALTNYIEDITTSESANIFVDHIGVWMPLGYSYVTGSVKINGVAIGAGASGGDPLGLVKDPILPPISHHGGTALIWDYSGRTFKQLSDIAPPPPGGQTPVEKFPPSVRLSFDYTAREAKGFFPWIKLNDSRIAWDTEAGMYYIQSVATKPGASEDTGTTVETYTPRSVTRYTSGSGGAGSAIKGDYIVIGNSLMTCCWNKDKNGPPLPGQDCWTDSCSTCCAGNPYRNYAPAPVVFTGTDYTDAERESYATVNSAGADAVPSDATIERAYLYWTAWLRGDRVWEESNGTGSWKWKNYMDTDSDPNKWENSILSGKVPPNVPTWLAANAYDGKAYLAVDGVKVTPTNAGDPAGTVVAGKWYISQGSSDVQPSYQYACFANVTDQVRAIRTAAGGATFTVAGVHAHPAATCASSTWNRSSNAGWSLIIIYSSAEKETHQIYLYEGCDHLYQQSREFTIAGFEAPTDLEPGETNEAKLTVFASEGDASQAEFLRFKGQNTSYYDLYDVSGTQYVFNSLSSASGFTPSTINACGATGEISGVDIDTYTRTRPSGGTPLSTIVQPGDTSAKINVGSTGDGFELIYVVFSVRSSKVPAGGAEFEVGTMTYEIQ